MVGVLLAALLACAAAETSHDDTDKPLTHRNFARSLDTSTDGCFYEGRFFSDGEVVVTHEACLQCRCGRGAISCRRRSCEPLPEPPPSRCHVLHRRESCCPELHCPNGAVLLERSISNLGEEYPDTATAPNQVCVESGTAYSAGSAMSSRIACEQCFCLGGTKRCVRPQCLPPPLGCKARPSSGACCPTRYYCEHPTEHVTIEPLGERHLHDCNIDGKWVKEGKRVSSPKDRVNCSQCFCLRGTVRCQSMACAPNLMGCKPILAPGQCCPHQYQCDHHYRRGLPGYHLQPIIDNALISIRNQERSFRNALTPENQTTTVTTSVVTEKMTPEATTVKKDPTTIIKVERKTNDDQKTTPSTTTVKKENPITTIKVKRKTNDELKTTPAATTVKKDPITTIKVKRKTNDEQKTTPAATTVKKDPITTIKVKRKTNDEQKTTPPAITVKKDTITTMEIKRKTNEEQKTTPTATTVKKDPITTMEVKRKTNSELPLTTNQKPEKNVTTSTATVPTTQSTTLATDVSTGTTVEDDVTEQPDGSVKIMINGTINCTAELSSTAITVNTTSTNNTKTLYPDNVDIQPRIPNIVLSFESHTYNPNDIITDRNYNEDFDDNESYTINVTSSLISSLRTNATVLPSPASSTTANKPISTEGFSASNISKKTKDDYDYNNYNKPTLPPSLPNLKIIPFVAADAVVDDEISSKESLAYPMLERDDKYPVYYPSVEAKDSPFATRREDLYNPTQFPIFLSKKVEPSHYPISALEVDLTNEYPSNGDIITSLQDFAVTASPGANVAHANKAITKLPNQSASKFELQTPAVNLFSPPVETEGGFIPKDPGIIDDYYAIYPTTPPGSAVPHLTTSMQLDSTKDECSTGDGRRVLEGESVGLGCSVCTCVWGELLCSQRPCHNPPGCKRRSTGTSLTDLCCGDVICNQDNATTPTPFSLTTKSLGVELNNTKDINYTKKITEYSTVDNSTAYSDSESNFTSASQSDTLNVVSETPSNRREIPATNNSSKITDKIYTTERSVYSITTVDPEESNISTNNSQEYDDEEEDEGFSFGSVLKLLLSDSYETTTEAANKRSTMSVTSKPVPVSTTTTTTAPTTENHPPKPNPTPFSMPPRPSYMSPMNQQSQNAIYRIDHLVLGESTAIKKTTPRPTTVPFKPMVTRKPPPIKKPATQKPTVTPKPIEVTKKSDIYASVAQESVRPSTFNSLGGLGGGLLKLAGCNIYGQMYRVGRIIAELSTPCQECRCTEIGVQCRQLGC